jgi:hypothetical protein
MPHLRSLRARARPTEGVEAVQIDVVVETSSRLVVMREQVA